MIKKQKWWWTLFGFFNSQIDIYIIRLKKRKEKHHDRLISKKIRNRNLKIAEYYYKKAMWGDD